MLVVSNKARGYKNLSKEIEADRRKRYVQAINKECTKKRVSPYREVV